MIHCNQHIAHEYIRGFLKGQKEIKYNDDSRGDG